MKLLYLDCSTEWLVVGLAWQEGQKVGEIWKSEKTSLNHAPTILGFVEKLLSEAGWLANQLEGIACSVGPGSFTGLRIGLCTAKGLAEGYNLPLVEIDALQAMALAASLSNPIADQVWLPVIDARKGRFYTRPFLQTAGQLMPIERAMDLTPGEFLDRWGNTQAQVCGYQSKVLAIELDQNWPANWNLLPEQGWEEALANLARTNYSANKFLSADSGPLYVRSSDAEQSLVAKP